MTALPAPLTPAGCDLRDEPFPYSLCVAFSEMSGVPVDEVIAQIREMGGTVGEPAQ